MKRDTRTRSKRTRQSFATKRGTLVVWDMIEVQDLKTAQSSVPEISRTTLGSNNPSTKLCKGRGTQRVHRSPPGTASSPRDTAQGESLSFWTRQCPNQLEFRTENQQHSQSPSQIMGNHAWGAVDARAGIQRPHTRQTPFIRLRLACPRSDAHSTTTHCILGRTRTNDLKPTQATPPLASE